MCIGSVKFGEFIFIVDSLKWMAGSAIVVCQ